MKSPQRLLVPIDQSDYSFIALKFAEDIAEIFGAKVTVLYVEEHDGHAPPQETDSVDRALEFATRQKITRLMVEKQVQHTKVDICIRHGRAASRIVSVAKERNTDLIVMSTHGRTGLGHILMGSVTEKVVRYAPCPVLTIKPEEFREIISLTEDDVAGSLHLGADA